MRARLAMALAMMRVMALELWRDRAALVMTFLLPPLVFLIFSSVFAGTSGDNLQPKIAVADQAGTEASRRVAAALLKSPDVRAETAPDAAAVRSRVKSGQVDAGLVISADPARPGKPFLIIADPSRAVAAPLTQARTQQALAAAAPDVVLHRSVQSLTPALGVLTPVQSARVDAAAAQLRARPPAVKDDLFAREDIAGARKGGAVIAYYAGAVMILFALFSAMQGALSLMEERRAGVADRLLAGVAGMGPVVTGKFLFLTAQAFVQAVMIFMVAQAIYGVEALQHLALWLPTTLAAGICSAGLALGLVSLCRTRDQAQMLSTFVILVLAAIGGSMAPRFLMPAWLQSLGWFTPHAWVIDAYQAVLWRDAGIAAVYKAWLVLAAVGAAGLLVAQALSRDPQR
ncbi:ABC transporter permease [Caulobacter endophyticus]|uniref:ABC transporter permease n=1 Tax=Caulobacter endophyticus TaxID=2172652 RepID=A0A2T9KCM2_9CAUL|nr:ABC transporter permease [Caulobacter endophyticus]PVM93714.1 ABC transporter permease [Caulobacter endophyticus]